MTNILIVRLGSLGDIVHALPVAGALRTAFPRARIDWLVDARYRQILDLVPIIDRRLVLSVRGEDSSGGPDTFAGWRGLVEAVRTLRQHRYDAALDLQGLLKSAVWARGSGARRVIGFSARHLRERAARLFYTEVYDAGVATHIIEKNLALLASLGIAPGAPRFPIESSTSSNLAAVRARLPGGVDARFALINPGAAWSNKRWPPERFGSVAAALLARYDLPSVVVWGPGEEDLARQVADASRGAAIVAPPTAVVDLVALARAAMVMISGDTGPLHLAAAVGTPLVGLYGPTNPDRNGPWGAGDLVVSRHSACRCPYERRCRQDRPCLFDVSVDDVVSAIDRRLGALDVHA